VTKHLLIVGLGYSGTAVAKAAVAAGLRVTGTARDPDRARPPAGVGLVGFDDFARVLSEATHLLVTASPGEAGDPVLAAHGAAVRAAGLTWVGYISTTGVYGDHDGNWVDEATPPTPTQDRTRRRVAAEQAWATLADDCAVDVMRAGGIYGPGRSVFDELRDGTARRTVKPGHSFSRVHRDDIAHAVMAAIRTAAPAGLRIFNLVDDEPVESAVVVEYGAQLLGMQPPPAVPFAEAAARMSPMARSFWSENRRVANAATKVALGISWLYPSYREGLAAILRD
jgi:nucleoside-diphosphate-sugar epimerase